MDTRWKRFSRANGTKVVAFSLVVIMLSSILVQFYYVIWKDYELETLIEPNYVDSDFFERTELSYAIEVLNLILDNPESESWYNEDIYFLYYITDGESTFQNATLETIDNGSNYYYYYNNLQWHYGVRSSENKKRDLHFSFSKEYVLEKQSEWQSQRELLLPQGMFVLIEGILSMILIGYLIIVTGLKAGDEEVHLSAYLDRVYSDIILVIGGVCLLSWFYVIRGVFEDHSLRNMTHISNMVILGGYSFIIITFGGLLILSLARNVKVKRVFSHSLIYSVIAGFMKGLRIIFNGRSGKNSEIKNLQKRQVRFIIASAFMVLLFLAMLNGGAIVIVPILGEAFLIYWFIVENGKDYQNIYLGMEESFQEQMKSERMKIDLITNVSHDLKTPLTSIISYVDLLSKEELSEAGMDYVKILGEKSERLKHIVSDLFDLAKSTSGNLPMNFEMIDLKKLVEQTLGDMGDEIEKSGMQMKVNLVDESVIIYSDGKRLYRILQNVIDNALKYSLQGTRVFLTLEQRENRVQLVVKNTSAYEMTFTAEEVLQRFHRGDESRSSEGSGLGLSIAESFTRACGGNFKIDVDGDQFKVMIEFMIKGFQ